MGKKWFLLCLCLLAEMGQAAPVTPVGTLAKPSSGQVGVFRPQTKAPVMMPRTVTPVIKSTTTVAVVHPISSTTIWKPTTPITPFQPGVPLATDTSAKDAPTTMGGNVLSQPKDFKNAGDAKGASLQHNVGGLAQTAVNEVDPNDKQIDALKEVAKGNDAAGSVEDMKKRMEKMCQDGKCPDFKGFGDKVKEKVSSKPKQS